MKREVNRLNENDIDRMVQKGLLRVAPVYWKSMRQIIEDRIMNDHEIYRSCDLSSDFGITIDQASSILRDMVHQNKIECAWHDRKKVYGRKKDLEGFKSQMETMMI